MPKSEDTRRVKDSEAVNVAEVKAESESFRCPQDGGTVFHKAEFGQLVDGVFVVSRATYRCLTCHREYNADGTRAE